MKERKLALLLCFFVFLGGVTSTLSKAAMEVIPPFSYLAIRYSFAALILICVRSKHLRKAFHKTDCKVILQVGFFFTIGFIFYNLAVAYTTVTNACFYYSISVLILPFLARIFNGTKFNSKIFVGIFITMVGMYFMMKTEEGLTLNTGDIFALCSAFFFALHVVFMSKYVLESDPVVITEGQFLLLSFISAIIALGIGAVRACGNGRNIHMDKYYLFSNGWFCWFVSGTSVCPNRCKWYYSWTDLCTDANFYNDIGRCYAGRRTNFAWKGRSTFSCPRYYYRWQAEYLFNGN